MTDKLISASKEGQEVQSATLTKTSQRKENTRSELMPVVVRIDEKIQRLKKKKERIQTQQALLFVKEVQRIFKDNFTPDVALTILSDAWGKASETQKGEWRKRAHSFCHLPFQDNRKKAQTLEATHHES
jgi:hypothetical protein